MEVNALKQFIKIGNVPQFLIFCGPEWKVQEIYIQKISEAEKLVVKRIDSITDILSKLKSPSFVSTKFLYVVRDDKEIIKSETVQDLLSKGLLRDNKMILLLSSVDKRTKFYTKYKDEMVQFDYMRPDILKKYITQKYSINEGNLEAILGACGNDFGHVLLELDKAVNYASGTALFEVPEGHSRVSGPKVSGKGQKSPVLGSNKGILGMDRAVEALLQDGTIYTPANDAIFALIDAILDHKRRLSFALFNECILVGESTLVMLSVLYQNAKKVLQVQSCHSKNVGQTTGLNGWEIKNAYRHINKYSTDDLIYMLELIQKVEKGVKTGMIDEQYAMQYVLVMIL